MNGDFSLYDLLAGLFGGLALFLFGMDVLTNALRRAAGDTLRNALGWLTRNRFVGVATGALITGLVNSSSVTTVLLVGFVSAGILSMSQCVAVIMGANIGSTLTAQILAFNVSAVALPMVTLGVLLSFLPALGAWRDYGRALLGVGLVFYGMSVMSGAMLPLRDHPAFEELVRTFSTPLAAAAIGMAFTAVIQSSAATTGLVIVMAGQGLFSLETAIAVALGANVGTCATAGLAAIGKPREAVRAALVHILFNVAGVLIWIGLIPELSAFVRHLSSDTPRQIANAHTLFNLANTFIFLGFTSQIARLVEWMVPDRPLSEEELELPRYLDEALLATPGIALDNARLEIGRLGERVLGMLREAMPAALAGRRNALAALEQKDKAVDALHRAIAGYLGEISLRDLSPADSGRLIRLLGIANDLEHIGDRIATDIVSSTRKRLDEGAAIGHEAAEQIRLFHREVARALEGALEAVVKGDTELAAKVRAMKGDVGGLAEGIARSEVKRLASGTPKRLSAYVREIEFMEILDGIFKVARRIARSELQNSVQEPDAEAVPGTAAP